MSFKNSVKSFHYKDILLVFLVGITAMFFLFKFFSTGMPSELGGSPFVLGGLLLISLSSIAAIVSVFSVRLKGPAPGIIDESMELLKKAIGERPKEKIETLERLATAFEQTAKEMRRDAEKTKA